jgi:hypothetical protein
VDQPSRSLLQPQQLARDLLPSDVFQQLHAWVSHGIPVDCDNDWSQEAILMAQWLALLVALQTPQLPAMRQLMEPQ